MKKRLSLIVALMTLLVVTAAAQSGRDYGRDYIKNHIKEYRADDDFIDDVEITEGGEWFILVGNNGHYTFWM